MLLVEQIQLHVLCDLFYYFRFELLYLLYSLQTVLHLYSGHGTFTLVKSSGATASSIDNRNLFVTFDFFPKLMKMSMFADLSLDCKPA